MATVCHYTLPEIDAVTLPQVNELFGYWRKHPPLHELAAAYIGYKPPLTSDEAIAQGALGPDDFARWVQATGGKLGPGG